MGILDCKAFMYVVPTEAEVTVIDDDFRRMGDVDYDGEITRADLDAIADKYGTQEGDPDWDPLYDLNDDGIVDIMDVVTAAHNYGKKAPSYYTPFTTDVAEGKLVAIGMKGPQVLEATTYIASNKKIMFFFSWFGVLGRPVVR